MAMFLIKFGLSIMSARNLMRENKTLLYNFQYPVQFKENEHPAISLYIYKLGTEWVIK